MDDVSKFLPITLILQLLSEINLRMWKPVSIELSQNLAILKHSSYQVEL